MTEDLICAPGGPQGEQTRRQRSGAAGAPGTLARRKQDDALGKTMGGSRTCAADADCGAKAACRSGVCLPCGRPRQACCGGSACKSFGKRAVTCQFDPAQGDNMCVAEARSREA